MNDNRSKDSFETQLIGYFHQPGPSPQFSARLAHRLRAEPLHGQPAPRRFRRGWAIAAGVILVLFASIFAAGPDRVLAMLKGLLGYQPGVGTITLDGTLTLPEPVALTRDGITLTVQQVTATADKTIVTVQLTNLPDDQPVFWERSRLRLPGGEEWFAARVPKSTSVDPANRTSSASFDFGPLPPGTDSLIFIWRQFGGKYQTDLIHQWEIPVQLRFANSTQLAPRFGAGYRLEEESATNASVSLQVLEIITTPDRTLLHVRWTWPAEHWDWQLAPDTEGSYLQDREGRRYLAIPDQTDLLESGEMEETACADGGECRSQSGFISFEPVPDTAAGLRLSLPAFILYWAPELKFDLDLGVKPAVGDAFKLAARLALPVGDGALPLASARIEPLPELPGSPTGLRILPASQPASAVIQVETIWFRAQNKVLYPWAAAVWEDGQIPAGILPLEAASAQGRLLGPWVVAVNKPAQP